MTTRLWCVGPAAIAALWLADAPTLQAQRVPLTKAAPRGPIVPKTAAGPMGPAPTNVRVTPTGVKVHTFNWARVQDVSGFRVFKMLGGQWASLCPAVCPIGPVTTAQSQYEETWTDNDVVVPGTLYRFTWVYKDGREGSTDFAYANPAQAQPPTGLQVRKSGAGAATLSWLPVQGALGYRVFGTGRPADGTLVTTPTASFTNLLDGTYTWQVTADYGGVWGPGPSASITLKSSGRYRVVANGFRVIRWSGEESLLGMMAKDEVYAGFAMFHVGLPQGQILDQDLRQTLVHGDAGKNASSQNTQGSAATEVSKNTSGATGLPQGMTADQIKQLQAAQGGTSTSGGQQAGGFSGVQQAGTGSLTGGLQGGDVFPAVLDPSQRYGQVPTDHTFPFRVWDGMLTDGKDAMVIYPTMWESDANDAAYTTWFLWERTALPQVWADLTVQQALKGTTIGLTLPPTWTYFPTVGPLQRIDHPIGSLYDMPLDGAGKRLTRRALILTRDLIESALNGGSNGIVTVSLIDVNGPFLSGNAHYILYLQVERVL